jgi:2-polyprenyl-6-hydroxyphenyl methylase/3-demethylubiquinone-9 3-methyltransferase
MTDNQVEISAGTRFAFGANWKSFVELVDEPRIAAARRSLIEALGVTDMTGRTFLDIGCGSELLLLAAHQFGARVWSFDFDPDSLGYGRVAAPPREIPTGWSSEGRSLDEQYLAGLDTSTSSARGVCSIARAISGVPQTWPPDWSDRMVCSSFLCTTIRI